MIVETRVTLIKKIADPADERAWEEFAGLYAPVILAFAKARGLQHEDAADVTQEALVSVARAIRNFEYDRSRGTFRSWLYTIARRRIADLLRRVERHKADAGLDDIGVEVEAATEDEEARWDAEFRRHVLHEASQRAREEFSDRVWRAFSATALEECSVEDASRELDMRPGAIYVARHRVMKRLQVIVQELTEEPSLEGL